MNMMVNKLNTAIRDLYSIKQKSSKEGLLKPTPSKSKTKEKNFSMLKKYLNPMHKSIMFHPSTAKHSMDKSMHYQTFEKKKVKVVKKSKKTVNYTTIRKQIPSFERSVESTGSGFKVLKQRISNVSNNNPS